MVYIENTGLRDCSGFLQIGSHNWGEPERAPHLSVVDVYVGASRVRGV